MKRQTYLRDESLLTLLSLHDFIIPEIQREYVWGSDNNSETILKPFLESIKNSAQVDPNCHYAHGLKNIHIGFLYSYKPQYIRDASERITDEFLIDGQQRFTSLFFLLLVRAVEEDRLLDFNNLIRWEDGTIAFDYKVRHLTHKFINDFIQHIQSDGKRMISDIVKGNYPNWLMNDYLSDTTIKSIIGAIKCIQEVFNANEDLYYDYLLTRIHFWHFKTDVTSQGEELYITMNSRGEELADNEVQKVRKLKSVDQMFWGPKWEEWQTYFWRNRGKGDAKNFDADKGFNNLLSCIDAMGKSFNLNYDKIEYTELAVEALKFIVETNWESTLNGIASGYYSVWIKEFHKDIWVRINTTDAKWIIEKDSDTTQRENAVLLWPLFYYYFEQKDNKLGIDYLTFIRLMHMCYLNYKSKKTNHAFIKEFIDDLRTKGGNNMLSLISIKEQKFLSEENVLLSDIINCSSKQNKIESLIWEIQNKKFFLNGDNVGGNTIIDYIKSIQRNNNVSLEDGLELLKNNYETLFGCEKNKILLKRILLHYKGNNNELFWKQTSPFYDRNYETSSWERIIRHSSFIKFYEDISRNHTYEFSQKDLDGFIVKKQDLFFAEPNNRNFTISKWSDRRIAILIDTVTKGHLWDDEKRKDLGFSEYASFDGKPFIGHTRIGNRICGKRFRWHMVSLPSNWEWYLEKVLYPFYKFIF